MTDDSVSIFRPATSDEKANFIELGKRNSLDMFLGKLATKQQEHQKNYQPFCTHCARVDFEKKVRDFAVEAGNANPDVTVAKTFDFDEFKTYADIKRFDLIDERETREEKLVDRIRHTVTIGKEYTFRCKVRGCGITIFVPTEDIPKMEAVLGRKKVEETKEVKDKK